MHLPAIQRLRLTDGRLTLADEIRRVHFNGSVSADEGQNPRTIGGLTLKGTGTLNDKPFDLRLNGAPLLDVDHSHPYSFEARIAAADIKLDAHVTISHPFDLASVRARFDLSSKNLADVYYLTGLALPNTAPYEVSGTLEREGFGIQNRRSSGQDRRQRHRGRLRVTRRMTVPSSPPASPRKN